MLTAHDKVAVSDLIRPGIGDSEKEPRQRMNCAALIENPRFLPMDFRDNLQSIRIVEMSLQAFKASVFLDERVVPYRAERYDVPIECFIDALPRLGATRGRYIFHGGFACSTLLARYLELSDSCFVLKEPFILTRLAFLAPQFSFDPLLHVRWKTCLSVATHLLARPFHGRTAVVKLADVGGLIGADLMSATPYSSGLCLTSVVSEFVIAVLKDPARREWIMLRLALSHQSPGVHKFPDAVYSEARYSPGRSAALYWLANHLLMDRMCTSTLPKTTAMAATLVAESPRDALQRSARSLDLPISKPEINAMLDNSVGRSYSKKPGLPFCASDRRARHSESAKEFALELDDAVSWVKTVFRECGAALSDGDYGL